MSEYSWWQSGVIYQVYPRSFQDTDGNGVGDLPGVARRLDYLKGLGVDAVWLSPIYPSPMADFGYDVADYTGIHPLFGTMADFDRLVEETHRRGLKLILDFVPNHTSDQHPWFLESRSSRDNPKRDWYLWHDPGEGGGPPNNWLSVFGGSGWEFDGRTGQYYYHAFLKEQPDLNWRNPDVRRAMYDVLRFWLDRGVDGFRVDVLWHLIKDDRFRDNPPNPDYHEGMSPYKKVIPVYSTDLPMVHDVTREMRSVLDRYGDRLLIGEIYLPVHDLVRYYGENMSGAQLPFNFQLLHLPWQAKRVFAAVTEYEAVLPQGAWPNWVLGNHDNPRIATRVGRPQAKVAAMLLLTLRGTPTMYYGDEIGMIDVPIPPERVQDPAEKNVPGIGLGRDPERTPMQWDTSQHAGFTDARQPWLPLGDDWRKYNVQAEEKDPGSFLSLHKKLLAIRRGEPALSVGDFVPVHADDQLMAFERDHGGRTFLVVLNMSGRDAFFKHPHHHAGTVRVATDPDREGQRFAAEAHLAENEGLLVEVNG